MLYSVLKTLVLPPTCFFVLFLVAWLLMRWRPRAGRACLWASLVLAYLATTPFVAGELMAPLQPYGPVDLEEAADDDVGAIVVLGAGIYYNAPEYWRPEAPSWGIDVANSLSLERLEYAAYLAKATGKPVLLSGGATGPSPERTVAEAMQVTLQEHFGVPARWLEDQSTSTMSNAAHSARLLLAAGIRKVYLVTHAWHMPRAMIAFDESGIEAIPAPTRFMSRAEPLWQDFIPSAPAFLITYYAVHEWVGVAWYRLNT